MALEASADTRREELTRLVMAAKPAPFWLDRPDAPATREPLRGDLVCDLAVIGGGFSGLWAGAAYVADAGTDGAVEEHTRVLLRLRLAPVRRKWLAETVGEFIDAVTIAGMAAGLKERLTAQRTPR